MVEEKEDRFHADPLLPALLNDEQEDYFALGLIVIWPVRSSHDGIGHCWHQHYASFVDEVKRECFSFSGGDGNGDGVYFLPLHSLHITVATLFSATHISELPPSTTVNTDSVSNDKVRQSLEWQATLVEEWKQVVIHASTMDDWPHQQSIKLRLESARIAPRAGILLWKVVHDHDETNGMERIRSCLRHSVQLLHPHLQQYMRIPDIIHTTFLRYHHCLPANGYRPSRLHQILRDNIVPTHPLFGNGHIHQTSTSQYTVTIDIVKLVNCKIYLQGTDDDHPVYLTMPVGPTTENRFPGHVLVETDTSTNYEETKVTS
ncbi:hypothetical protein IV203_035949 [Nitzschia inconspicua]|uniref:Uncharacterized protein n=1 Tax=Nitzschia inconspicua TaxID=303405 RepID=A0A9K3PV20_9STRA|nr:hypothetical protein IV203_035949 [Nitzschia inconspicua]